MDDSDVNPRSHVSIFDYTCGIYLGLLWICQDMWSFRKKKNEMDLLLMTSNVHMIRRFHTRHQS